jgi:hypothetical protein
MTDTIELSAIRDHNGSSPPDNLDVPDHPHDVGTQRKNVQVIAIMLALCVSAYHLPCGAPLKIIINPSFP